MSDHRAETPSGSSTARPILPRARGLKRVRSALANSVRGLTVLCRTEPAFQQEFAALLVSIPAGLLLATNAAHYFFLVGTILGVILIEVLNTAVEATCNAVTKNYDADIRLAKDCGSLAVMIAFIVAATVWLHAIWLVSRSTH